MKKLKQQIVFIASCCLFYSNSLNAQNLVPNSGAENYSNCPPYLGFLNYCPPWGWYGSSDFLHICSDTASPYFNGVGWQAPHKDSGMLGSACFYSNIAEGREFITNTLTLPLTVGIAYCGKFFLSLADSGTRAIDSYGLLISDSLLTQYPLQVYTPQIKNQIGSILSDRTSWYEISGIYIAQGGEQYIHLGNFNNDANTSVAFLPGGGTNILYNWNFAYYFLDNVSLEEMKNAVAVNDTQIYYGDSLQIGINQTEVAQYTWSPSTGLNNSNTANPIASPTQTTTYTVTKNQCGVITTDEVTVTVKAELIIPTLLTQNDVWTIGRLQPNTEVRVYDASGRLVFNKENYQNDFYASYFSAGVYFYQIIQPTGEKQTGKLVIAR